jgi:hypothetical protein
MNNFFVTDKHNVCDLEISVYEHPNFTETAIVY